MARPIRTWNTFAGMAGSLGIHGLWILASVHASAMTRPISTLPMEVDLQIHMPPAPIPEPTAPSPRPEEPGAVFRNTESRPVSHVQSKRSSVTASAAKAGRVIAAPEPQGEKNTQEAVDFTVVQGEGTQYRGGVTAALGTSALPVSHSAGANDPNPGHGPARHDLPKDKAPTEHSRVAKPLTMSWDCSRLFPTDPGASDRASVMIRVKVRADGIPEEVFLLSDPGHGFGAAARACALAQRYAPALGRDGRPSPGMSPPITVVFSR